MPTVPSSPAAPDPGDRDPAADYVSEHELRDRDVDPDSIRILVPHATELRALDGARCWCRADLAHLLGGN